MPFCWSRSIRPGSSLRSGQLFYLLFFTKEAEKMKEGSSNKLFRAQTSNFIFNTGPENFLLQFSQPGFAIAISIFLNSCCYVARF